jgi:hypothetical protein
MKRSSAIMTDVSSDIEKPFYTRAGGRNRKQIACKPRKHCEFMLMFSPIEPWWYGNVCY